MEKFQENKLWYKEPINSYTSNDEFDLNTRVHMTNEIPPEDLFEMSHSLMKNEFWAWFLGNSYVDYDMDYNQDIENEVFDRDGTPVELTIAKYVNGARAFNYGPRPTVEWDKESQDYVTKYPTYKRIELTGVILPEIDLILHEGYRYLDTLYPNHPDFLEILTKNEFDDKITHAAYLLDYFPDLDFFDLLSTYLDYENVEANKVPLAKEDEAAKLKIRNLLNYSYTQKFAGSKTGYKMFGSDIFQHISIFQVGEYLPAKSFAVDASSLNKPKNIEWNIDIEKTPSNFKNKIVDYTHQLYRKLFRIIDFTNESYEYDKRHDEPITYYATAYPTPKNKYNLYEYPLERVDETDISLTKLSMADDFNVGDAIKVNGQNSDWQSYDEANIATIHKEDSYRTKISLTYNGNSFVKGNIETVTQSESVTHAIVDKKLEPMYTELTVYPNLEELFDKVSKCTNKTARTFIINKLNSGKTTQTTLENYHTLKAFYNVFYGSTAYAELKDEKNNNRTISQYLMLRTPKVGKFILDPHQNGALLQPSARTLSQYEDTLGMTVDFTHKTITYKANKISEDAFVHEKDVIMYEKDGVYFVSEVDAINNGQLSFKTKSSAMTSFEELNKKITEISAQDVSKFGAILKVKSNNKYVVLFGKPTLSMSQKPEATNGLYYVDSSVFDVTAIPRVKDHAAVEYLYPTEISQLSTKKLKAFNTLFSNLELLEDCNLKTNLKEYNDVISATDELYATTNLMTVAANSYVKSTSFSEGDIERIKELNDELIALSNEKAVKISNVINDPSIVAMDKEIEERKHNLLSVGYILSNSKETAYENQINAENSVNEATSTVNNADEDETRKEISTFEDLIGIEFTETDEVIDSSFRGPYQFSIDKYTKRKEVITSHLSDLQTSIVNVASARKDIEDKTASIQGTLDIIGTEEDPKEGTDFWKIYKAVKDAEDAEQEYIDYKNNVYEKTIESLNSSIYSEDGVLDRMIETEDNHSSEVIQAANNEYATADEELKSKEKEAFPLKAMNPKLYAETINELANKRQEAKDIRDAKILEENNHHDGIVESINVLKTEPSREMIEGAEYLSDLFDEYISYLDGLDQAEVDLQSASESRDLKVQKAQADKEAAEALKNEHENYIHSTQAEIYEVLNSIPNIAKEFMTESEVDNWPTEERDEENGETVLVQKEAEQALELMVSYCTNLISKYELLINIILLQLYNETYELATKDFELQVLISSRNEEYNELVTEIENEYNEKTSEVQNTLDGIASKYSNDVAAADDFKRVYDTNRSALKEIITSFKELFGMMPTLKSRVISLLNNLYDVSSNVVAEPSAEQKFQSAYKELLVDYIRWLAIEITIDLDSRDAYRHAIQDNSSLYNSEESQLAIRDIAIVDNTLDSEILPNRAFLLDVLHIDAYMQSDNSAEGYSLQDSADLFYGYFQYDFEPQYQDYLVINVKPELGATGLMTNVLTVEHDSWDFGSLCTVSTVETHFVNGILRPSNVTKSNSYLKDSYKSSKELTLDITKTIDKVSFVFRGIDRNIYTINHNKNYLRKFSYSDPNFMELFLLDENKNNIRGEEALFYNVKLHGYTELGSTRITFKDPDSNNLGYLSTGCQVLGETIQNDVYIQEVNLNENYIEVDTPCLVTGDFDLKILTRVQFMPEEEGKFDFRKHLSANGLADVDNMLDYKDNISQAKPQGYVDTGVYYSSLLTNLREQDNYRESYNKFVRDLYKQRNGDEYVVPSSIDFEGDLFFETNAYRLYGEHLMKVEILDYLDRYLDNLSRASDDVNVGVNVNLYTVDNRLTNIDKTIKDIHSVTTSKFATSMPYYIKIGTGKLDNIFNQSANATVEHSTEVGKRGAIYGFDVYDDNVYDSEVLVAQAEEDFEYKDIDKPLFKAQLGENEVFKNIILDENYSKLTAVQFSVIKQQIENLKYKLDDGNRVAIASHKLISSQIIENMPDGCKDASKNAPKPFNYLGTYEPTYDGTELILPSSPSTSSETVINYYTIVGQHKINNETYYPGDLLMYESNTWVFKKLRFSGYLDTVSDDIMNKYFSKNSSTLDFGAKTTATKETLASLAVARLGNHNSHNVVRYFVLITDTSSQPLGLMNGQLIAVVWNGTAFQLGKLNDGLVVMSSKLDNSEAVSSTQYNTYTSTETVSSERNLTMPDKRFRVSNIVNLRDENILKGSADIRVKLEPNYTCRAYAYLDDGTIDDTSVKTISLTENNIFVDKDNKVLYTYNYDATSDKYKKYAIIQEDNKYFKNVLYTIGDYNEYQTLKNNEVEHIGEVSPIQGLPFDIGSMTTQDEILEIDQVRVRNSYASFAEPTLFSSYYDLAAYCTELDTSGDMTLTFRPAASLVVNTTNKMNFKTKVTNMLPVSSSYNDVIDFSDSEYDAPIAFGASSFVDVASNIDNIKYFKNNLLIEASLDQSSPNTIQLGERTDIDEVLSLLSNNDKVEVQSISSGDIGFNDVHIILEQETTDVNDTIKFAAYCKELRSAIAASDTKVYYKNNVASSQDASGSGWKVIEGLSALERVNSLCYSPRLNTFVLSLKYSGISESSLVKVNINDIESTITQIFTSEFDDINTFQPITIDGKTLAVRDYCTSRPSGSLANAAGFTPGGDSITTSAGKKYILKVEPSAVANSISVTGVSVFIYDNDTNRWVLGSNNNICINGLSYTQGSTTPSIVNVYHVENNVENIETLLANASSYLKNIPLPENGIGSYTMVYFSKDNVTIKATSMKITEAKETVYTGSLNITGQEENQPSKVKTSSAIYLSSDNGCEAIIDGNNLYIYNQSKEYNDRQITYGGLTDNKYWKKAVIPSFKVKNFETLMYFDNSYTSADSAYDFVKAARTLALDNLSNTSGALKTWLESSEGQLKSPDEIKENNKWPASITLEGILVQENIDGYSVTVSPGSSQTLAADESMAYYYSTDNTNYLGKALYIRYLMLYYNGILNGSIGVSFENNIKHASLTDDVLSIITKDNDIYTLPLSYSHTRYDIENYRHWQLTNFSTLSYIAVDGSVARTVSNNGTLESYSWPKLCHKNLYEIETAYFKGQYQILGGNIQATSGFAKFLKSVAASSKDTANELAKVVPWKASYETDTADFSNYPHQFCKVSMNGGQSYIDLSVTEEVLNSDVGGNKSNKITGVYGSGSYAYINYSKTDESSTIEKTAKVFVPTMSISETFDNLTNNKYLNHSYSFKANHTATVTSSSGLKGIFMLSSPIKYGEGTISSINADESTFLVAYNDTPTSTTSSTTIRVLVSVSVQSQLENPWKFISYNEAYFDSIDELLVPEYEVLSTTRSNQADRCYMKRECMTTTERSDNPRDGFVSVTEDTTYRVSTSYTSPYIFEDEDYVDSLNESGHKIILCDVNGNYLLSRDKGVTGNVLTLKERLELTTLNVEAYPLLKDFDSDVLASDSNTDVTAILSKYTFKVKKISSDNDDLKVIVNIENLTDNDKTSLQDILHGVVNTTVKMSLSMPYESKYGTYKSSSHKFILEQKTADGVTQNRLSTEDGKMFNYVYLPINGYGSSIDLSSWNERRPEQNDPEAFETYDLRNTNGELVYACDVNGQKIFVKNGRFIATKAESTNVNYANLSDETNYFTKVSTAGAKTEGILYRRKPTSIDIYMPTNELKVLVDEAKFKYNGYNKIGYMSLSRSGVEINANTDDRYQVLFVDNESDDTFTRYVFDDEAHTSLASSDSIYYDFNNKMLYCKNVYFAKENLFIKIVDTVDGTVATKAVNIKTLKGHVDSILVTKVDGIKCNSNKVLQNNDNLYITFDCNFSRTPSIEFSNSYDLTPRGTTYDVVYTLTEDISSIKVEDISLNLKKLNFNYEVLYINSTTSYVYSGESDVTSTLQSFTSGNKTLAITALDNTAITITAENAKEYDSTCSGVFNFTTADKEISYSAGDDVSGIYGPLILKTPKFETFKNLIDDRTRVIDLNKCVYSADTASEVISISKLNARSFDFSKLLGCKGTIQIKALPVKTVTLNPKVMNNSSYYIEVPLVKLDKYGYDRVWINQSVNHLPAIEVGSTVFSNEYSFSEYASSDWKNKDGYKVHYCDESGKYCFASGTESLSLTAIGTLDGDCSSTIYQDNDNRIVLKEANFVTNYDKYLECEYVKGIKNNCFVPYVHVKDFYDSVKQSNVTKAFVENRVNKYGSLVYEVSDTMAVSQVSYYDTFGYHLTPYVDHTEGKLKFGVYTAANANQYGIVVSTGLQDNTLSKVVDAWMDASYILYSSENLSTREKDSAIVDITEVGIFDKYDNLLAYATHPPVQYRTDDQHISYTWIIKPENL